MTIYNPPLRPVDIRAKSRLIAVVENTGGVICATRKERKMRSMTGWVFNFCPGWKCVVTRTADKRYVVMSGASGFFGILGTFHDRDAAITCAEMS